MIPVEIDPMLHVPGHNPKSSTRTSQSSFPHLIQLLWSCEMDILQDPPHRLDFTLLSEHQSQTPSSVYDGPAILYHQSSSCTLKLSTRDLAAATALEGLVSGAKPTSNGQVNGHAAEDAQAGEVTGDEEQDDEVEVTNVDVWVTSE